MKGVIYISQKSRHGVFAVDSNSPKYADSSNINEILLIREKDQTKDE
jgi:hypothetical protein